MAVAKSKKSKSSASKKSASKKSVKKSVSKKRSVAKKSVKKPARTSVKSSASGKKSSSGSKSSSKPKVRVVKQVVEKFVERPRPAIAMDAHPDKVFILVNGKRLKNVKELADILDKIEDDVFNHHVTDDRNDFANWLRDVFKDLDLAREIAGCKDKDKMQLVLYKHIAHKLW